MSVAATPPTEPAADHVEFRDAFVALLTLRPSWLGRLAWLTAHVLCLAASLALLAAAIGLSVAVMAWLYRHGIHSPFRDQEEIQTVVDGENGARRTFVFGVIGLAVLIPVLTGLLRVAGRGASMPAPVAARPEGRVRERITRGQRAMRKRWMRAAWISAAVVGAIICVHAFEYAPWAPGLDAWGRVGHTLLLALTAGALVVLPLVAGGTAIAVGGALYLIVLIAGWIGHPLARWAHLPQPPSPPSVSAAPEPHPERPRVTPPPSSSLLVYLFADRFIPPRERTPTRAPVPCSGVSVDAHELASTMLAVAFWKLRRDDVIRLTTRRLWRRPLRRSLVIERVGVHSAGGLEADIATFQTDDPSSYEDEDTSSDLGRIGDLRRVVKKQWFKGLVEDPDWQVAERVVREAQDLGIVQPCPDPASCGAARASSREVRCDRRRALQGPAAALAKDWQRFAFVESELSEILLHECDQAISESRGQEVEQEAQAIAFNLIGAHIARRNRDWPHDAPSPTAAANRSPSQ